MKGNDWLIKPHFNNGVESKKHDAESLYQAKFDPKKPMADSFPEHVFKILIPDPPIQQYKAALFWKMFFFLNHGFAIRLFPLKRKNAVDGRGGFPPTMRGAFPSFEDEEANAQVGVPKCFLAVCFA